MKKLLGLTTLVAALLLVACGGNGGGSSAAEETTCTFETFADTTTFTVRSEDDTIISATMEMHVDVSDWEDEEIEHEIDWLTMTDENISCDVNNNTLICSGDFDEAELTYAQIPLSLQEFLSEMEVSGAICE